MHKRFIFFRIVWPNSLLFLKFISFCKTLNYHFNAFVQLFSLHRINGRKIESEWEWKEFYKFPSTFHIYPYSCLERKVFLWYIFLWFWRVNEIFFFQWCRCFSVSYPCFIMQSKEQEMRIFSDTIHIGSTSKTIRLPTSEIFSILDLI